jgi:hypothetical protein
LLLNLRLPTARNSSVAQEKIQGSRRGRPKGRKLSRTKEERHARDLGGAPSRGPGASTASCPLVGAECRCAVWCRAGRLAKPPGTRRPPCVILIPLGALLLDSRPDQPPIDMVGWSGGMGWRVCQRTTRRSHSVVAGRNACHITPKRRFELGWAPLTVARTDLLQQVGKTAGSPPESVREPGPDPRARTAGREGHRWKPGNSNAASWTT